VLDAFDRFELDHSIFNVYEPFFLSQICSHYDLGEEGGRRGGDKSLVEAGGKTSFGAGVQTKANDLIMRKQEAVEGLKIKLAEIRKKIEANASRRRDESCSNSANASQNAALLAKYVLWQRTFSSQPPNPNPFA
jgi:hypothetical protein